MTKSLRERIDELSSENQAAEQTIEDKIRHRRAKDQSRIAWLIIWAFVICVSIIFLFVTISNLWVENTADWKSPAEFLLSVVSSVMLPVVTLVLGYYFGKEKASNE